MGLSQLNCPATPRRYPTHMTAEQDPCPDLSIQADGWLTAVKRCPSPNFNARPDPDDISLLVIHNISLPPDQFGGGYVQQFFCNQLPADAHPYFATIAILQVSAHVLIDRSGGITQFVSFFDRAWHAGQSQFAGRSDCNDYSLGIELEGADHMPYTAPQYRVLAQLTQVLLATFPRLNRDRIVGHNQIAPERKTDPGPAFDWAYYFNLLKF
jgi:N-acetyl-anhydromuramoyl-L-alanine amidase